MLSSQNLEQALTLLAEVIRTKTDERYELVVCGGSALLALKIVTRTTRDVDIIARLNQQLELVSPAPLPAEIVEAAGEVGKLLNLPSKWFNTGPSDQIKMGLPNGFVDRLIPVEFGPSLRVHYVGRLDLIHLKLFALVDQGPGKHLQDLNSLSPTKEELLMASQWVLTQDDGEVFPEIFRSMLTEIGHADIARQL